ncbi:GNAT family N-acetyltransferase, partial [Vibrio cholerae]
MLFGKITMKHDLSVDVRPAQE